MGLTATNYWSTPGRCVVFALGASSIGCLLFDFYGLCPMRLFTIAVLCPSLVILIALAIFDSARGNGQLGRAVFTGLAAGLLAAVTYDVFRLPFVFAKECGLAAVIPPMNLFKTFPRFGAMILGQSLDQSSYSRATSIIGWAYHFSNGATFGVMYLSMIGDGSKRHWAWAVLMAVGLELGMLLTPYPKVFQIAVTWNFVVVTMAAHTTFGVGLGLAVKAMSSKPRSAS